MEWEVSVRGEYLTKTLLVTKQSTKEASKTVWERKKGILKKEWAGFLYSFFFCFFRRFSLFKKIVAVCLPPSLSPFLSVVFFSLSLFTSFSFPSARTKKTPHTHTHTQADEGKKSKKRGGRGEEEKR